MNERSKQVRRDTIKLMYEHKASHYGGSLSCVEILIALYDHVLTDDDVFLLSKGHAVWPLYVILHENGQHPDIEHHPHYDPNNWINMTSGSLGHGLGFGIGVAIAKKIQKNLGRVFVLMGDGEVTEGTTWEAALIINELQLDNLTIIVDNNKIQGSDWTYKTLHWYNDVFFDHMPYKIVDGHNLDDIINGIGFMGDWGCIMADTAKGYGVSFMIEKPEWHSRQLCESEYQQALKELE